MKFLVIRKPRPGALVQPTSQMIRAQKEGLLAAIKRGEVDCAYAFVGGGGIQYHERRFCGGGEPATVRLAAWALLRIRGATSKPFRQIHGYRSPSVRDARKAK